MVASLTAIRPASIPAPVAVGTGHSISDNSLLERIACRDQLAMRAFFARHQLRVYRFILRIAHDKPLAEDVLSDVFFDVWQQAAGFESRSSVSTWLLAIARNKAYSALRSRRQHVELSDDIALKTVDPADGPDLALEKKDRSETIRRCLENLSPEHNEVIDLVYYHGKSVSEVAEIVNVREATVKTRMFYARKRMAELLNVA